MVHFASSFIAGFFATTASSPFDMVKSRYMNQTFSSSGEGLLYRSSIDCLFKTVRNEGFLALMKGWTAQFFRLGPHSILMFVFVEQFRRFSGLPPIA